MNRHLNPLHRPNHQLLQQLLTPPIPRIPRTQKQYVGGNNTVLPRSDRFDSRDNDVKESGEVGEGEDEHLVWEAAVPEEGVLDSFVFV
jgi:hypothetical protein